ncbi:MAG TPA: hypothetical protein VGE76_06045 [Opitutaceae bacterium]
MESPDLKSRPSDEDPLDALLRRPLPPLPDHGFTRGIMEALPPPAPVRQQLPIRLLIVVVSAVAGLVLAFLAALYSGSLGSLSAELQAIDTTLLQTAALLKDPMLLIACAIAAGSLLYVFKIAPRMPR